MISFLLLKGKQTFVHSFDAQKSGSLFSPVICSSSTLKVMLRNRSRAVTNNKQALMADHNNSLLSPTKNPTSPITSFLGSPRFFHGLLTKTLADSESPTSILDSKNSPSFVNPFGHFDRGLSRPQPLPCSQGSTGGGIGLALISDEEEEGGSDGSCCPKPVSRMALFGSRLKVQIPVIKPAPSSSPVESPKSPADFGIKTRNSQMISSNPFAGTGTPPPPSRDFTRQLSLKEMEMSEDYTCVIIHGPNPKTTHIFDDCVVECCCGDAAAAADTHPSSHHNNPQPGSSQGLLSLCHTCQDILGQGKDIYMYRGKKAFCSHECSCQEMFSERTNHPSELDATL